MKRNPHLFRHRGFTLIELLTVIAVIGILAAILIPTVGAARKAMNKASNRALFTQIANGIEAYRTYYGYYPLSGSTYSKSFDTGENSSVKCIVFDTEDVDLVDILMGVSNTDNPRQKTFVTFGDGDLDGDNQLIDAFGNTSIGVVIGQEGTIPASAVESLTIEEGDSSKRYTYDPDTTIRGRILIWSVESVTKSNNATMANFVTYPRMNTESTKQ